MPRPLPSTVRGPALLALGCFVAAGCGGCRRDQEAYPTSLTFPARQDWVVVELPKQVPDRPPAPGELEEAIRRINAHGGKALDPATIPESFRRELDAFLRQTFGTPAEPTVVGDAETTALAAGLGLTAENLAAGSKLFRSRCQECHGAAGDGRGVSAPWLTPHPRDFRQGAFKFTSTGKKPTRADLFRTLTYGLKPTAMPSFAMRTEDERHRLVDYVMYLSLRGRTEFDVLRTLLVHGEDGLDGDVPAEAARVLNAELRAWARAEHEVIPADPPALADDSLDLAESVRRGHALFLDPKGAGCAACHGNYGRDVKLQYDVWGTLVRPANLTEPLRKGGTAPADLFRRIKGGIHPANMPVPVGLTDAQLWDLVHFLRDLPHPDRLPDDVRARVYAGGK